MLNFQEKAVLGVALIIVLIKEKMKLVKDYLKELYYWLCKFAGCVDN